MKNKHMKVILGLFVVSTLSGCAYYKYTADVEDLTYHPSNKEEWQNLDQGNILVVHYKGELLELDNILLNTSIDSITFLSTPFSGLALDYYDKVYADMNRKTTRSLGNEHKVATRQIHIFLNNLDTVELDKLKFAVSDISRVDVVGKATNVPLIIGSIVGGIVLTPIVVLLILCNCPHVYIDQGDGFVLANSLFSGAIVSNMERWDYKQIPDHFTDSSKFTMHIVNELNEDQYTNVLKLIVALHSKEVDVIADKTGKLYTIKDPQAPILAIDNSGLPIINELAFADDLSYSFNADSMNELSEVYLQFEQPQIQSDGKLVLHLRNSPWAGYAINEFNKLFGKNYSKWVEHLDKNTKTNHELWMQEQGLLLQVDLKTPDGWENIDQVNLVGEISYNSIVIPIEAVPTNAPLEIRLRSAFMFWDLDYAAIDYSAEQEFQVQVINPSVAKSINGTDFTPALCENDENYMELKGIDTSATITFDSLITDQNLNRTLILSGKGYYYSNKEYTGKTNKNELQKFRMPGELSRYSRKLYLEAKTHLAQN